jgi:hypothetical protein
MSYLLDLCLFAHSGVQHILCCVFVLFFFALLPVFWDCPFFIAPSVNVYIIQTAHEFSMDDHTMFCVMKFRFVHTQ